MIIVNTILSFLGWDTEIYHLETDRPIIDFTSIGGSLICLQHTNGPCEFLLWSLYRLKLKQRGLDMGLVLSSKPIPKRYIETAKKWFDLLPIDSDGNGSRPKNGSINRIIQDIKIRGLSNCIIDPSGDAKRNLEWKSGYRYICEGMGWKCRVVGFDFVKKRLYISDEIEPERPDEIKDRMGMICPYRPRNTTPLTITHDTDNISFLDENNIIIIITFILLVIYISRLV